MSFSRLQKLLIFTQMPKTGLILGVKNQKVILVLIEND